MYVDDWINSHLQAVNNAILKYVKTLRTQLQRSSLQA